ncbi:MAG: phage major capsid protein [Acidimicrobiales bacterium]
MRLADVLRQRRDAAVRHAEETVAGWDDHRSGSTAAQMELERRLGDADLYGRFLAGLGREIRAAGGPYGSGEHSFYRDVWAMRVAPDERARARLAEHRGRVAQVVGVEHRAAASSAFGGLVPPGFLSDAAGTLPRPGRPLLDALLADGAGVPLPPTGVTLTVPVAATGFGGRSQTAENAAATADDLTFVDREVPVVTIVGRANIARQALERGGPGLDAMLSADLAAAIDAEQERHLVAGSGAGGEMHGILSTTDAGFVSCTATTGNGQAGCVLQAARLGGEERRTPTRIIAATPTRILHWVNDANGDHPNAVLRESDADRFQLVRSFGIPTTLGAGTDEDRVVTLNGRDVAYAEEPVVRLRGLTDVGDGTIAVIGYRYAAMAVRFPTHLQTVSGSGLSTPAAFT